MGFSVKRAAKGRKAGKRCVKPGAANALTFSGRLRGRALAAGGYRLRAVATGASGKKSKPAEHGFKIVKR